MEFFKEFEQFSAIRLSSAAEPQRANRLTSSALLELAPP